LRLDGAGEAKPGECERLRAPMSALDDGVAGIDGAQAATVNGSIDNRQARKSGDIPDSSAE
jgi:hypothetical protein